MVSNAPTGSTHTVTNENNEVETENTGAYYNEAVDPLKNLQKEGQLPTDPSIPTDKRVVAGEIHNHTSQSNDAGAAYNTLEHSLDVAFREDLQDVPQAGKIAVDNGTGFDYLMTSEHLRWSPRDINGQDTERKATWESVKAQVEAFNKLKAEGKYAGKVYYPGFEWDMFGLDHAAVAIIEEGTNRVPLDAYRKFEWLYAYDTATELFKNNEFEVFGPRDSYKKDKTNSYDGLRWLEKYYPKSLMLVNHPSRHNGGNGEVRAEDIRKMLELAPSVVFGVEGMPGNQMGGDRGETRDIYGGTDVMVAKVGGVWDSLLGEGRPFYNFANSDFHFKVSENELYSSGYWPSEYSRNYSTVSGNTFESIAQDLKKGNTWSVYGDLISGLEFFVTAGDQKATMGETLKVAKDTAAKLTIRFKDTAKNNYKPIYDGYESTITNNPILDHIDLIIGNIYGKVADQRIDYNPTTRIANRFTDKDWTKADADGWHTIELPFTIDQDMYMRLRGTNHAPGTEGQTDMQGNPLLDPEMQKPKQENFASEAEYMAALRTYLNQVNERNYADLWFYANPINLIVDDQTVTLPTVFESAVRSIVAEGTSINLPVTQPTTPQPTEPTTPETPGTENPTKPEVPGTEKPNSEKPETKPEAKPGKEENAKATDKAKASSSKVAKASTLPATGESKQNFAPLASIMGLVGFSLAFFNYKGRK
ncbi:LPXTG cell wall anchor domain-containing protein [Vaginisenegalia massiliensis]|uniref:LPXTG cell wall anchor domain-containing protein n=1 Tax=Vaginisenegalia massiliensis TaxID=2058294 RepID=UPI000F54455C|nr:LPXTG cell wall anchor domain-containing protein [Vaginisenegalia massiliensis]